MVDLNPQIAPQGVLLQQFTTDGVRVRLLGVELEECVTASTRRTVSTERLDTTRQGCGETTFHAFPHVELEIRLIIYMGD